MTIFFSYAILKFIILPTIAYLLPMPPKE